MSSFFSGLLVVGLGLFLMLLIYLFTRLAAKNSPSQPQEQITSIHIPDVNSLQDAILLVEPGGRVLYSNGTAKKWFGYKNDDEPNLERLIQRFQPHDSFLGLCFSEGQARFSFDGKIVEGRSFYVPFIRSGDQVEGIRSESAMLVSLQQPEITRIDTDSGQASSQTLDIFSEISGKINTNSGLEPTITVILESVESLITSDLTVFIYQSSTDAGLTRYQLAGVPGFDRSLVRQPYQTVSDLNLFACVVESRQPVWVNSPDQIHELGVSCLDQARIYQSFLGIPLFYRDSLVGTIHLFAKDTQHYKQNDLVIVTVLARQAAAAVHNAARLDVERRESQELSSLANLSLSLNNLQDFQELLGSLIDGISELVQVEILGFLLYRESHHILEAQVPFKGIPEQLLDLYRVEIPPGSEAEATLQRHERIIAEDAVNDTRMKILGLDGMAVASGIQTTILVPLKAPGRVLGYMQVADRLDNLPFDQQSLKLLETIGKQASTILENGLLLKESQNRAQRAETLRRVASLAGSTAPLDEILIHSLRELVRLLRVDYGFILLLDEYAGDLRLHSPSIQGLDPAINLPIDQLNMADERFQNTVTGSMHSIFLNDLTLGEVELPLYLDLFSNLEVRSVMSLPFIVRGLGVGELHLLSKESSHFDQNDLTLVSTSTSQISVAIEKAALYGQTDENLRRRVVQLLALNRVSRELSTTLELQRLLTVVYDQVVQTTEADCGTILLFEPHENAKRSPKVSLHIGDADSHSLTPLELKVLKAGEPYIVKDYWSPDPDAPDTMPIPPHSGVRSSLIVPIAFQDYVAGLIHLHARTQERFDETSQEIALSLAVQAAIALGNAQRFKDQQDRNEMLNRRVETMTALLETSNYLRAGQPLEDSLEMIAYGIQSATPFEVVLISIYNPEDGLLHRTAGAGIPLEILDNLSRQPLVWEKVQKLFLPRFQQGNSYFIPYDSESTLLADFYMPELESLIRKPPSKNAVSWQPRDLLLVPLEGSGGEPLGLIRVDAPRNGLRPDKPAIESLEIFASQAALVAESYNSIGQLAEKAGQLEGELTQVRQELEELEIRYPALEKQEQEKSALILQTSQKMRRLQAAIKIADQVDQLRDRKEILSCFAAEILSSMDMDTVLLGEMGETGLRLIDLLGEIPEGVNPQALLGQRNPLRTAIQSGSLLLAKNLDDSEDWKNSPLLNALDTKAFICQPIWQHIPGPVAGDQPPIDSAILAISQKEMLAITSEDIDVLSLIARQVTISLQNLQLLNETNQRLQEMNLLLDFNRQLGLVDPVAILRVLVESVLRVIASAEAGMAALWSSEQNVLMPHVAIGYSMNEKILEIAYQAGNSLPGKVFSEGEARCIEELDFAREYDLNSEQLLIYRDATRGRLPVSCLVIPLQTFDSHLGVLVLDNFRIPGAFNEEDQALVLALAHQTSLTLQNVQLYRSAEARAVQLQALTEVASIITSSLQTEDLVNTLLVQARSVVPFDTGIFWLRQDDQMMVQAASGYSDVEQRIGLSVALEDSLLLKEMTANNAPISVGDVRVDDRFPALIEPKYLSWLGVPLLTKGEVVGVIVLEKTEPGFFSAEHVQAMVTFAGQASVALENATLYEDSVQRAEELNERSIRLTMLNQLSTALSGTMNLEKILGVLADELRQVFPGTRVTIALVDEDDLVQVYLGDSDQERLPDAPVFAHLKESLGVFSTEDIANEPELEGLIPFLEKTSTQALLLVPLVSSNRLIGITFIQSGSAVPFPPDEVALALTISNQVAVAIQNARLFTETERLMAETRQSSSELAALFDLGVQFTRVLEQSRLLDITFENVKQLIDPDTITISIVESEANLAVHSFENNLRGEVLQVSRSDSGYNETVLRSKAPLLIPDSAASGLPGNAALPGETNNSWLGVPLLVRGVPQGVLSVHSNQPNTFGTEQLHLLSQIANQLSVALDNAHLFQTVQSYTVELEQRVSERTEQVEREHRRIQTLLSITTELSASLDLDTVLNRTLGVLNDTIEAEHSSILLTQIDSPYLFLRVSLGYTGVVPQVGQVSRVKRDEGLAGWVITNRQAVLVDDLHEDSRWLKHADKTSLHRSAMVVPLMVGEEILGVMMVFHRNPMMFNSDQLDLVQAIGKQIAIAINNTQLYGLIRDQAERLGDMLRTQHVETSRSQAILEAVADGVLVTDAKSIITLFNESAESILVLDRVDVLGRSLEHFTGLFGKAAQSWVRTIRSWSEDPESIQAGETYEAQLELDNRRVVSVHLSPVQLRSDFLGTVSIFRDITHQVEVDRLKSEFVATVSHELRTPMTSIKGYVEILLMGAAGDMNAQQVHFLEVVKGNTERLAVLVNDLLDVSRLEAGKVSLSLQPVDIAALAQDIREMIQRRMASENRAVEIIQDIPEALPRVNGDPERVRQILDNLMENAYRYTPTGGHIWITLQQVEQHVRVDIRDDGIGIKPEESERVFERFYRGEDPLVLASSGTGLGLSIVQTLINMHHGRIWFESEGIPGRGSVFSFELPIYTAKGIQNEDSNAVDLPVGDGHSPVETGAIDPPGSEHAEAEAGYLLEGDSGQPAVLEEPDEEEDHLMMK